MDEAMIKWGAAVFISFYVIKVTLGYITSSGKFVLEKDCRSFRTRIGKESDEHRMHISCIKSDITEIKENVAFLRGREEGRH